MNKKQEILYKVIDICIECCNTQLQNGGTIITRDMVLSKERIGEVADWTRCVIVMQLLVMGYTTELIAKVLNRTPQSIADKRKKHNDLDVMSFVYHVAYSEATSKCREIMAEYKTMLFNDTGTYKDDK